MADQQVTTSEIDWMTIVQEHWGERWSKPDWVYQWSNGRKMDDTGANGGPYANNPPADH